MKRMGRTPSGRSSPLCTTQSYKGSSDPISSRFMGALMNLEEIGSVLRWHETNGTYPKRTIKSAVYDAELQGLIRSDLLQVHGRAHEPGGDRIGSSLA